jgi:hypothetical protein
MEDESERLKIMSVIRPVFPNTYRRIILLINSNVSQVLQDGLIVIGNQFSNAWNVLQRVQPKVRNSSDGLVVSRWNIAVELLDMFFFHPGEDFLVQLVFSRLVLTTDDLCTLEINVRMRPKIPEFTWLLTASN